MADLHRDNDLPLAETVAGFAANLAEVRARIHAAAVRAGREPDAVRLLPVSKTVPEDRLIHAIEAGATFLGENKVQEAYRKWEFFREQFPQVQWAVIGHLQTNKAREVAEFATEFQALDSVKVAEALDRRLEALDRTLDVFVQVNTSAEPQKYGIEPDAAVSFARELTSFPRLRVQGLMTLAVFSGDREEVRGCFRRLVSVRDTLRQEAIEGLSFEELSMGMSGDYELAIEEGSTVVRVGTAIFGARRVPDAHYWPEGSATR